ncbi:hypothetical protein [Actinoplanes nipponensis]|uniref:hypothetical protein n=1 Tax=Actinoplanes nipponensis TaxID=135950 RepID=UPI0031ED7529
MSMWLTPSATASRSTRMAGAGSGATVRRIEPKPIRRTVCPPSVQLPAAAASIGSVGIGPT